MTILPNPHSSQHHLSSFLGSILLSAVLCPLSCISFLTLPTIPYTSSDCTCQPPNSRPWLGMSSKVVFDKPVGAYADVAEIEYISALMQTDRSALRKDGTLLDVDIQRYLVSRHGIQVDTATIQNALFHDLAGGNFGSSNANKKNSIDLVQVVAMLIIPYLLDQKAEEDEAAATATDYEKLYLVMSANSLTKTTGETTKKTDQSDGRGKMNSKDQPEGMLEQAISGGKAGDEEESSKLDQPDHSTEEPGSSPFFVFDFVARIILEEIGIDYDPKNQVELTTELVRDILEVLGETDCLDPKVLHSMVHVAAKMSSDANTPLYFNGDTLKFMITHDVKHLRVEHIRKRELEQNSIREPRASMLLSEGFYPGAKENHQSIDVFDHSEAEMLDDIQDDDNDDDSKLDKHVNRELEITVGALDVPEEPLTETNFSALTHRSHSLGAVRKLLVLPYIDDISDTYYSVAWTILLWLLTTLLYFSYFWGGGQKENESAPDIGCSEDHLEFGCEITKAIKAWLLVFARLTLFGVPFIIIASGGNSQNATKSCPTITALVCAILSIVIASILPFIFSVHTFFFTTEPNGPYESISTAAFLVGCVILTQQILQLLQVSGFRRMLPTSFLQSAGLRKEHLSRKAYQRKAQKMISNATDLFLSSELRWSSIRSSSSQLKAHPRRSPTTEAMMLYRERDHMTEKYGGIIWGWKMVLNGNLYREEGIWVHSRLWAQSTAQFLLVVAVPVIWIVFGLSIADVFESDPVMKFDIEIANSAGAIGAFGAIMMLFLVLIPSSISTVVKFRTGVYGSLRSESFLKYRKALDQANQLFGSALWGGAFTTAGTWILLASIVFLTLYPDTQDTMMFIIAHAIGIAVTMTIRISILLVLRFTFYHGYYRHRPTFASVVSVFLEVWNIGLGLGTMAGRTAQLVIASLLYIGRLDTPFIADGQGDILGLLRLDNQPLAFRKDLLVHEAHRHPYIEALGRVFLNKLKSPTTFAHHGPSCWRMVFVLTLMPWLRKYRARTSKRAMLSNDSDSLPFPQYHSHSSPNANMIREHVQEEDQQTMASLRAEIELLRRNNEALSARLNEKSKSILTGDFSLWSEYSA